MGRYWGGGSLGAVIIGCVVYGIQLGWGVRGCGLVCSMSSGFSSGCCSQWGFLLLNTIINPYYHSCVFMTDIYLTISLSTHNGDDTPQNSMIAVWEATEYGMTWVAAMGNDNFGFVICIIRL